MYAIYEDAERLICALPYPLSIGVLTNCTGTKLTGSAPAEELYIGEQHRRLMQGVRAFRDGRGEHLDLYVMSAKYGVVRGDTRLESYDACLSRRAGDARRHGRLLGLPAAVRCFLSDGSVALKLVALGAGYFEAGGFVAQRPPEGPTIVLASEGWGAVLANKWPEACVVPLRISDTRRFSCGLVGLKGEVARRLLLVAADRSPPATSEVRHA